jgi:hypothetical protein
MLNVVKDMEKKPVILFSSSASVYGIPGSWPIDEGEDINPISPYGNTKAMTETILNDYSRAYGIHSMCFRYFNAAGAEPFNFDLGQEPGATHIVARALEASIANRLSAEKAEEFKKATAAAKTLPLTGDELANIAATGWGGTAPVTGATLRAVVNGTPSTTNMPSEWIFGTHDGTSLADRIKITKTGQFNVNTISNFSGTDLTIAPAGKVVLGLPSKVRITGGTSGQALVTDGAGNLSWATIAGAAGAAGIGYVLASTSSVAVGTGTKTFTTNLSATNSAFVIGSRVRVISTVTPTTYMEGTITAFATTTMTISVDDTSGTGTLTSWKISIAGQIGATGATGTGRGYFGLTSTTSLAIAEGAKTFTVNQAQGTNAFVVGQYVRAFGATATNYMEGYITAYTTTSLTITVDNISGTGTLAAWTITATGSQGAAGPTVYPGAGVAVSTGTAWGTSKTSPTGNIVGTSDTQTLTNKWMQPRVLALTNSATPAINTDNYDTVVITGQILDITSMTSGLTGTPVNGQTLSISITGSAGTPTIAWGTSFESSTITLPTNFPTARIDVGFIWNVATSKWRCVSLA